MSADLPHPSSAHTGDVPNGAVHRQVQRWRNGERQVQRDALAEEVPVAFTVNGEAWAVMLATPADLDDFAYGFALGEGVIDDSSDLQHYRIQPRVDGIVIDLHVRSELAARLATRRRAFAGHAGCGLCGLGQSDALLALPPARAPAVTLKADALRTALIQLPHAQPLNLVTGAVHAAAWCSREGRIELLREDIGRHNALDKLIGARARVPTDDQGFLLLTSRAGSELVLKAARAGIAAIAAISAPTALAVALADSAGIVLAGFARAGDCTVYAHPERYRAA